MKTGSQSVNTPESHSKYAFYNSEEKSIGKDGALGGLDYHSICQEIENKAYNCKTHSQKIQIDWHIPYAQIQKGR
jgi:hypothetical protein